MHPIKQIILNRNDEIMGKYHDETHTYISKGKKLTSVTTFKKKYFPFEAEILAKKLEVYSKGKKTAEQYIEEWKETAEFGTHIHKLIENYVNGETLSESELNQITHARRFIQSLGLKHIAAEIQIYSPSLGLAGTIDWLCEDRHGNLIILDWKTTKTITEKNPYEKATYPINHIDHCKTAEFSFQTEIYAFILNNEYNLPKKIEKKIIVQLNLNKTFEVFSNENEKLPNLNKEVIMVLFSENNDFSDFSQ